MHFFQTKTNRENFYLFLHKGNIIHRSRNSLHHYYLHILLTNYNYRHDDSSISKTEESDVIDIPPQNYFQNNIPELTLPLNEESPSFEDNNTKDSNSSAK